jgi:hypothetical protein
VTLNSWIWREIADFTAVRPPVGPRHGPAAAYKSRPVRQSTAPGQSADNRGTSGFAKCVCDPIAAAAAYLAIQILFSLFIN